MENMENIKIKVEKDDEDFIAGFQVRDYSSLNLNNKLENLEENVAFLLELSKHQDGVLKEANTKINHLNKIISTLIEKPMKKPSIETQCQIYIRNLNYRTTVGELKRYFQRYGSVVDAFIIRGQCGFIEFTDKTSAEIASCGHHVIDGKYLYVERSSKFRTRREESREDKENAVQHPKQFKDKQGKIKKRFNPY